MRVQGSDAHTEKGILEGIYSNTPEWHQEKPGHNQVPIPPAPEMEINEFCG